jgi:hypothetical protein
MTMEGLRKTEETAIVDSHLGKVRMKEVKRL